MFFISDWTIVCVVEERLHFCQGWSLRYTFFSFQICNMIYNDTLCDLVYGHRPCEEAVYGSGKINTLFYTVWEIITKSNLGQRYKRELVHLQQRLFSTLSAQLTFQYSSSCHCGNAHPCTPKAGQLLGLLSFSLRAEKKEAAHNIPTFQSPLCTVGTY